MNKKCGEKFKHSKEKTLYFRVKDLHRKEGNHVTQQSGSFLQDELQSQKQVCDNLARELSRTKQSCNTRKNTLANTKGKLAKVRLRKAVFHRNKLMLARREKDISALRKTNDPLKDVICRKCSELKKKVSAVNYLDKKIAKLTSKVEREV